MTDVSLDRVRIVRNAIVREYQRLLVPMVDLPENAESKRALKREMAGLLTALQELHHEFDELERIPLDQKPRCPFCQEEMEHPALAEHMLEHNKKGDKIHIEQPEDGITPDCIQRALLRETLQGSGVPSAGPPRGPGFPLTPDMEINATLVEDPPPIEVIIHGIKYKKVEEDVPGVEARVRYLRDEWYSFARDLEGIPGELEQGVEALCDLVGIDYDDDLGLLSEAGGTGDAVPLHEPGFSLYCNCGHGIARTDTDEEKIGSQYHFRWTCLGCGAVCHQVVDTQPIVLSDPDDPEVSLGEYEAGGQGGEAQKDYWACCECGRVVDEVPKTDAKGEARCPTCAAVNHRWDMVQPGDFDHEYGERGIPCLFCCDRFLTLKQLWGHLERAHGIVPGGLGGEAHPDPDQSPKEKP
jgi:hypothetical protein